MDDLTIEADQTYALAAELLARARHPVFAGLGTDVAGVQSVLRLAARLGASVDHHDAAATATDLRVFADAGQMTTTTAETRQRADLILLVGQGAVAHAEFVGLVAPHPATYPWRGEPHAVILGSELPQGNDPLGQSRPTVLADDAALILPVLSALRARLAGRPVAADRLGGISLAEIDATVAQLTAARFTVLVYDAADLDTLAVELLHGLVKDLNATTRATTLSVPGAFNARAANTVAAWTTGGPLRLGFGRGAPVCDAWVHDAERLVNSGEADVLVWVAALGPELPDYAALVPTIALVPPDTHVAATVVLAVGVPGHDHGGTLYEPMRDGFAYLPASEPSAVPSVATVVDRLAAAIFGDTQ